MVDELKAYNSERIYWAVEQVEQEAGDIADLHLDDNLFYIKSEVDEVIAEKDAEICRLKRALWLARAEWARSSALSYHLIESHPDKDVAATYKRKANKWENAKDKCLKKAEEYK